ncbi:MAG TPA: hypothetical protein VF746_30000 [Longimicrobium sp.]|jgi:hypothetical protein
MKKLGLKLDELAVDSFATLEPKQGEGGTVEAFMPGCTGRSTCTCPSSIYQCGTVAATFSCRTKFDC